MQGERPARCSCGLGRQRAGTAAVPAETMTSSCPSGWKASSHTLRNAPDLKKGTYEGEKALKDRRSRRLLPETVQVRESGVTYLSSSIYENSFCAHTKQRLTK